MKEKFVITTILIVVCLTSAAIDAQTRREVLTNAKIIELVRLGLDDEIIVEKIRQSECQCDTGTAALTKLKAAKVSKPVMLAMLEATANKDSSPSPDNKSYSESKEKNSPKTVLTDSPKSSGLSSKMFSQMAEPGIYLLENGEIKQIEAIVFSGTKANPLMGAMTYGIKKTKFRAKVRGKSANMQILNAQPEFYFIFNPEYKNSGATMAGNLWLGMPATSPAEFMLVQMNVKENSREAVMGEYGAFTGMSMGARDQDIREYAFEKIKPGIYKVVPKTTLVAGEYCFYYAGNVNGLGLAGGKVFDFSVIK